MATILSNTHFFSEHKFLVQLQLFYDDLEIVSPLGSKNAVHKLGAIYFRILILPRYMTSALSSIHLLLLC